MNRYLFRCILIIIAFNPLVSKAQMSLNDVQLDKIPQKKVREYLLHQFETYQFNSFTEIQPTFTATTDASSFHTHYAKYMVNEQIDNVWQNYIEANPSESWEGKRFSFGFLFNRSSDALVYPQDGNKDGIEVGQMFYVNLKLLRGVYKMAVGFEIITLDTANRVVEFSYIEGGNSKGKQRIELQEMENGKTRIVHTSFFKSDSKFRDKFLYPFFHQRIINEFHRKMRKRIKS